jgi:hypothetical protein
MGSQDIETKKSGLTGAMAGVALKALSQLDIQKVSRSGNDPLSLGHTPALRRRAGTAGIHRHRQPVDPTPIE